MSKLEIKEDDLIRSPLKFYQAPLSGYGKNIKTGYKLIHNGRLHRIYSCCYGNTGMLYIKTKRGDITVDIY